MLKNIVLNSEINADTVHIGDIIIEKSKLQIAKDWFEENLAKSIKNLGERYSEKLNFELTASKIFNGLARNEEFRNEFEIYYKNLINENNGIIISLERFNDIDLSVFGASQFLKELGSNINKWNQKIEWENCSNLYFDEISNLVTELISKYYEIRHLIEEIERLDKTPRKHYESSKYQSEKNKIYNCQRKTNEFIEFINSYTFQLAISPFMLLKGEAGIGKSHHIADIASNHQKNGGYSILLLGQYFIQDEIWTQILKFLSIPSIHSKDDLLILLNEIGKKSGNRLVFFIDAINEGEGRKIWKSQLAGFLQDLKKYDWLGLVLSIRSDFIPVIIPNNLNNENQIVEVTHQGFRGKEYLASQFFFKNFDLQAPKIPLLNPEFSNPLFLLLFCKGLKKNRYKYIPEGMNGITKIMQFFLQGINQSLSGKYTNEIFNKINFSNICAKEIAQKLSESLKNSIGYDEATIILNNTLVKYCGNIPNCTILTELVSEGLFKENVRYNYENKDYDIVIEFNYERFGDYTVANYLLDNYIDNQTPHLAFEKGNNLHHLIKDDFGWRNQGIIQALSVILPEKMGVDFYEIVPKECSANQNILLAFIRSLLWRSDNSIKKESENYINIIQKEGFIDEFLDVLITITSNSNHIFNANYLHEILYSKKLTERDSNWTIYLQDKYTHKIDEEYYISSIKRLIDWAWSDDDKSYLSEDSIYLSSKTMIWFLSSSNRNLRDSATKALVCLLKNHLSTLSKLLDDFKDVNDPYILERVLAVCYGVVLNTPIQNETQKIAQKAFDYFFKDGEPPIHLLTREYARGICAFAISNKIKIIGKVDLVYPPYKSKWETPIPLEECIKKYKIEDFVYDKATKSEIAQYSIVTSTSESFYDFNKYEIGKSSDFSILKFNTKEEYNKFYKSLSNTKKRFLKISKDYHNLTSKRRYDEGVSEIIKKALLQIEEDIKNILTKGEYEKYLNLAKPYFLHSSSSNSDEKFFDNDDFVSFIIQKIFDLGWKKEIFGEFDGMLERNYYRIGVTQSHK